MQRSIKEFWKPIKGYEGLYEVSTLGRIKRNNIVLNPTPEKCGFIGVTLCKNGNKIKKAIHKLVAEHFLGNSKKVNKIIHINGNNSDNRLVNLKYETKDILFNLFIEQLKLKQGNDFVESLDFSNTKYKDRNTYITVFNKILNINITIKPSKLLQRKNLNIKPIGHWNKSKCHKESLKYDTRTNFQKNSGSAYTIACKNNWLDEICSHMILKQRPNGYWNKKLCHIEALKYKSRTEFQKKSSPAYDYAIRRKWMNDICKHMVYLKKPNGYWNKDKCIKIANKFKTKKEFKKKYPKVYWASVRNKWLKSITKHMTMSGNKKYRFVYAFEFKNKYVYVGLSYNIENREYQHLNTEDCVIFQHIKNTKSKYVLKNISGKPLCVEKAQYLEHKTKLKYTKDGWNILNRGLTGVGVGSIGGNDTKWTKEECHKDALKYKTRTEFHDNSGGAYDYAIRRKWMDDICGHMKNQSNKIVLQLDLNNKFIKEWASASEAERSLNIGRSCISKVANSKTKSAGGYKWKYK
jgi:hypothetical protein